MSKAPRKTQAKNDKGVDKHHGLKYDYSRTKPSSAFSWNQPPHWLRIHSTLKFQDFDLSLKKFLFLRFDACHTDMAIPAMAFSQ
jgi:hypothetical protein